MERLSSGKRINSAMDDAAGLTIAHNMSAQVTSLNQATRNANDGIAMINLAEGAMDQVSSMLERMKELATQSANGTYNQTDRDNLNSEFTALKNEITRIGNATTYNDSSIMNSSQSISFQIGDKGDSNNRLNVDLKDMRATAIGSGADTVVQAATAAVTTVAGASAVEVSTQTMAAVLTSGKTLTLDIEGTTLTQAWDTSAAVTLQKMAAQIQSLGAVNTAVAGDGTDAAKTIITITGKNDGQSIVMGALKEVTPGGNVNTAAIDSAVNAQSALGSINDAMKSVDTYRADLGAVANRLEHTVGNLMTRAQHTSAAMSRIMDTDYATESANLAKQQVLQQAGTAMLAQANASTQNVLSLLK
jgi:flagellin